MNITISPNAKPYYGRWGMFDLLTDSDDGYLNRHLRAMKSVQVADWTPIPTAHFSRSPWNDIANLRIDAEEMRKAAAYTCPALGQQFFSVVPIYLYAAGNAQEIRMRYPAIDQHVYADMLVDKEWQLHTLTRFSDTSSRLLNGFQSVAMGPGFTDFFLPSDGSNSLEHAHVLLSNGDLLVVALWHWFNK